MPEDLKLVNNKKLFRFEIPLENNEHAVLQYRWLKGNMVLMHTLVPKTMQRKGIGTELVKLVLEYIKSQNFKIVVYCPFVERFIQKNPEYKVLIADPG
jgi:predicted GNAT family acetyltransferase